MNLSLVETALYLLPTSKYKDRPFYEMTGGWCGWCTIFVVQNISTQKQCAGTLVWLHTIPLLRSVQSLLGNCSFKEDQIQLWLIAGHWWPCPPHTKPTKPRAGITAMVSCHLVPQLPPNLHLTSPLWHHHQHHPLSQLLAPLSHYTYKSTQRVRRPGIISMQPPMIPAT